MPGAPHRHQLAGEILDRLPPSTSAGGAARPMALRVMAAMDAGCEVCVRDGLHEIGREHARTAAPLVVNDDPGAARRLGVASARSITFDAAPTLAERVLADMTLLAAVLVRGHAAPGGFDPAAVLETARVEVFQRAPMDEVEHDTMGLVLALVGTVIQGGYAPDVAVRGARSVEPAFRLAAVDSIHSKFMLTVEVAIGVAWMLAVMEFRRLPGDPPSGDL